ncbi:GTP 3',8-cyclase MoaA [Thalassotalea euphylliae]|uniref:GTP 3',8-cyclase n=1 Tax=Thalassotalea euphylliae TaxID=1655234 RepID=A0A3E0TN20_9GAMM|nr:GTP 3',8-cyclase MoaA [Thalassotalea euphylliae]REL25803.1 GTP 3',8-cyclase MoaA [Thalassotalea euphylliae]
MLQDSFGRRFYYLRLSITDVCNFRCQYCLPDGYTCEHDRDFLTLAEIEKLAATFAQLGTEKIRITGGEPSLRKDLPDIIRRCKQTPGIKQVAITTNGFKLPEHLPAWLDAGLDAINISIDSLDPKQFQLITGHNKLATILTGIDQALAAPHLTVKVNTVLMRGFNGDHLAQFLAWVKDKPVSLRFIELMQTGDNATFFDQQHVSGDTIKQALLNQGWMPALKDKTAGPAQEFYHPEYAGKIGLIMPYSKDFCASCNRLRISSLGKLHLCLFAEQGHELRHLLANETATAIASEITALMADKKVSHFLQDRLTGATKHLAMLGG